MVKTISPQVYWDQLREWDGKRLDLFERAGIPAGWVVNGKLDSYITSKFKAEVIPLHPGGWNLQARFDLNRFMKIVKKKYGPAIMIMVPCDQTNTGWLVRPILLNLLNENPGKLLADAMHLVSEDIYLSEMYECLYMALTGVQDLS